MATILYRNRRGIFVRDGGRCFEIPGADWDDLFNRENLPQLLAEATRSGKPYPADFDPEVGVLPPVRSQEVWAAGVTYHRSRTARMEESRSAGGSDFYDRVYNADRPELFLKATPHRVVGHGQTLHLRSDSRWIVPEPELALAVTRRGRIFGYTIGNDLSCRDIEGENPLYLPQAKTFERCCALGPGILVCADPLPAETEIHLEVRRAGAAVYSGSTTLSQLRKTPASLVEYLYRDNSFPQGCILLTGTGIVPPDDFTLRAQDEVSIAIGSIGALVNKVA